MEITITSKLTFKDYLKFNLSHVISQSVFIYLFFVIIIPIAIYALVDFEHSILNTKIGIIFLIVFLLLPFLTYLSSKRHFNSNKRLTENMVYTVNEDSISIKGESFNTMLTWIKIHKTKETKNAFLIYESNLSAIIIPKRFFKNEEDIQLFRSVIPLSPLRTIVKSKLYYLTIISFVIAIFIFAYASKDRYTITSFYQYFYVLFSAFLGITGMVGMLAGLLGSLFALIPSQKVYKERFMKLFLLFALGSNLAITLLFLTIILVKLATE